MGISLALARKCGIVPPKSKLIAEPKSPLSGPEVQQIWLTLSCPPSTNHTWKKGKGRVYLAKEVKAFRKAVQAEAYGKGHVIGRLQVTIWQGNKLDIDNSLKGIFDACQNARLFDNDDQIDKLIVNRDRGERKDITVLIEGE